MGRNVLAMEVSREKCRLATGGKLGRKCPSNVKGPSNEILEMSLATGTLPTSSSSLFFIRGVKPDFTITEELLSIRSLHGSTKGAEIFQQMMTVLKDAELDPAKLVGVATDGAPSMLGLGEGLQGHITRWRQAEELKPVVWHHCIVHQENLVAKSLKFKHVTDIVFSTVNWIRANALNHRQFKQFLVDINADYGDVIIFTAVRWLSRSSVIKKIPCFTPRNTDFPPGKGEDVPQLNDNQWLQDLAFFVDITGHLAHLNLQLQGKDKMCHELFATLLHLHRS
ncbi:general transcription factor II-I repeat domain-containing protein 2A-like [Tachypleus tridentatus]|uniref:general transcription factor II-I repeat domain-containing protein 2A-like n=1 Tax=Tachypleus tridentatus TaxID=6853 RepID=UPI003FCFC9A3